MRSLSASVLVMMMGCAPTSQDARRELALDGAELECVHCNHAGDADEAEFLAATEAERAACERYLASRCSLSCGFPSSCDPATMCAPPNCDRRSTADVLAYAQGMECAADSVRCEGEDVTYDSDCDTSIPVPQLALCSE